MIKQLQARTKHVCHVCNCDILPGCEYIQEKYREGIMHYSLDRHIHCDAVLYAMDSVFLSRTVEHIRDNVCATYCDKYDSCEETKIFSCDVVHRTLLNPVMYNAARRSVLENGGDANEK